MIEDPGRPADFEELWRVWRPRAAAYIRVFAGLAPEDREEAASEAAFRAWRGLARYDPRRGFAPWFLAIARRAALDALARRRRAERPLGSAADAGPAALESVPCRAAGAEELAMRDADAAFVREFLARVDPAARELASLVYGQGLGVKEAAAAAGMPEGTAKWRLYELRAALRSAYEREYGETRVS